jgi:hypothetical protein
MDLSALSPCNIYGTDLALPILNPVQTPLLPDAVPSHRIAPRMNDTGVTL